MSKKIRFFITSVTLIIGFLFRFSYINWGYPYFFHPDENNIISSIGQLSLHQWNPHFFAYGGLPIYLAFIVSSIISFGNRNYAVIAYTLRSVSALLSFLLIPSLFIIGKKMFSSSVGYIAALLSVFSVGFIQFAHFGTFEMWLSFFTLWFFYVCFLLYKHCTFRNVFFCGLVGGILLSIKVSSLILLPIPFFILFFFLLRKKRIQKNSLFILFYLFLIALIFSITNPFLFFDTSSYILSLFYESSVAVGSLPVFYTQSFSHTTPVIFQILHIFPFLLNPFVLLSVTIAIIFSVIRIRLWKMPQILLFLFFSITFFSQTFLFVKWTRYMVPALPFIYLIIASFLASFSKKITLMSTILLTGISAVYAISFFFLVYPQDSRLVAASKITNLYGQKAVIEPYDLGALAFNSFFPNTRMTNIYDLETNLSDRIEIAQELTTASVFISPSQRIFPIRLSDRKDFPTGNLLYRSLFNGNIGYHIVYQTPCTLLCYFVYSDNPIYSLEQTATAFDHPFVTIFAKK